MKKSLSLICCMSLVLLLMKTHAQKMTMESGSFEALKSAEIINVEYNYDNMSVGKFENEQDYIAKKVTEYNKNEAGSGDRWRESWVNDRASRFQPSFEEEMNNMFLSKSVPTKVKQDQAATYTFIVHTTFTEPGYNIGVSRMNAYINLEIDLVETANPGVALAKMTMIKSPGRDAMGFDFDTGYRIQEAYAKAGKELAYYIWKNYYK